MSVERKPVSSASSRLGEFCRIAILPVGEGALGKLPRAVRDGVTVLVDQVKSASLDRDDEREVRLIHVGVDSLGSVGTLDHVLAELHPRIVVHDPRRDAVDRRVGWVGFRQFSCSLRC
jgi:hypothetical protein